MSLRGTKQSQSLMIIRDFTPDRQQTFKYQIQYQKYREKDRTIH